MVGRVVACYGAHVMVREAQGMEVVCRFRGRLRRDAGDTGGVVIGDMVEVQDRGGELLVDKVLPRRNLLDRPVVANVDQVLVVFAWAEPPLDLEHTARVMAVAERAGVRPLAVLNKVDLMTEAQLEDARRLFSPQPYPFFLTSAATGAGVDQLRVVLPDKVTVLAGVSGVGKSCLLNALRPGLSLRTGELSARLGRGRHTTRLARLVEVGRGMVADTPGFSRLDLTGVRPGEVGKLFPEMESRAGDCRFPDCLHRAEPECAVRDAVAQGLIAQWRYDTYLKLLAESEEQRPW